MLLPDVKGASSAHNETTDDLRGLIASNTQNATVQQSDRWVTAGPHTGLSLSCAGKGMVADRIVRRVVAANRPPQAAPRGGSVGQFPVPGRADINVTGRMAPMKGILTPLMTDSRLAKSAKTP
jgi:hypothetical protein